MKKTLLLILFSLVFVLVPVWAQEVFPTNAVKVGKCVVRGKIPTDLLPMTEITIFGNEFYTEISTVQNFKIDAQGNIVDEIPMHTLYGIMSLSVKIGEDEHSELLVVSQNDTLTIEVDRMRNVVVSGDVKSEIVRDGLLTNYILSFDYNRDIPEGKAGSLMASKAYAEKDLLPESLKEVEPYLQGVSPSNGAFLKNWAKLQFFLATLIYATEGHKDVPKAYYSFLNQLTLDEQLLYLNQGLSSLLMWLPHMPNLELPPIGESPVQEWVGRAREIWSTVPFTPTPFFCELMAFSCYMDQLGQHQPLSKTQLQQIHEGFSTGEWEQLLLVYQAELEAQLKQTPHVYDLSKETQTFDDVLKTFEGSLVLIEFWYTSCGPCRGLQKTIDKLSLEAKYSGIQFVDMTSPRLSNSTDWKKWSEHRGGWHYLLPDATLEATMEKHRLEQYPALLFYDKHHRLVEVKIGQLSEKELRVLLDKMVE